MRDSSYGLLPWPARLLALAGCALALLTGCKSESRAGLVMGGDAGLEGPGGTDSCATPRQGCACAEEGESVDCGTTSEVLGDYVTCSMGKRSCVDGVWGVCVGDRVTQVARNSARNAGDLSLQALGSTAACPAGFDPCDPECQQTVDSPGGFDAGPGFDNSTSLTLKPSTLVGCTSLSITPSASSVSVTQISPVTAPTITLTAAVSPPACSAATFATTWTIDRFDIGSITGSNNSNGSFNVAKASVGSVVVTAYALGLSATTTLQVKINQLQTSGLTPNLVALPTQLTTLISGTPVANTVTWLYPYASTFLPLGLPAPVIQYRAGTGAGGAVKVSLRYPSGSTASTASFNYSMVALESNVVSQAELLAANTAKPQVVIPQVAWKAFEQTARGADADLVIQRVRSTGALETESVRSIRIVDGQLKGTVFYNSYSSQLNSYNTGAVLKIAPGATAPTLAVQPSGKCTVCHTVNLDGTRLISGGGNGGVTFNKARRYDMTTAGPSPTVLNTYDASGTDTENIQGDKFNFGGPWTDGSLYMTHGGNSSTSGTPAPYGDKNWRAPPDYSRLYNPASPGTAISVTGWSNISAITPKFSNDGTKLAFGFWGSNSSTIAQSPSGTLAADTSGKTLAVVDFKCATSACTGTSTGWTVSNARNLTPSVTHKVGWPSFTPGGEAVIYQRQYKSSKAALTGWSPTDMNTVAGAMAELWLSVVPATKATAAVPTQLRALNGLDSAGTTSYLPTTSPYHVANGAFTINQADYCSASAALTGVNDYQLNYLPSFAPTEAGGYYWVVFTSRRMYGNIADDDPWDAEPGPQACGGSACSCSSGQPPTKKLWVAAIDKNITPGVDPSHAAFYLPGQELKAGNSDGYWVSSQCVAVGATCSSNDDCCGGTGTTPTTRCDATSNTCQAIASCDPVGAACASSSECCSGLLCDGTGKCANPAYFASATYKREYVATCAAGKAPVWRLFEWQSTIPTGTSIDLSVQTKRLATDSYLPSTALSYGTISATTATGVWAHGSSTANQVLVGGGLRSLSYLLVTMKFNPSSGGATTPSLLNWRQNYDCVDVE
ncbi:MAG: dickkopf-related protein [Polyangiaceae bacterium]